ncbi:MAG TPA: glycosyltransferase family protein [Polyangiaceae bacterium LLY-WYZ-15_(1-7)]|nr:teichoic acid biosynthesis protein [Myxococcales bacterium]MAT24394.1 teichoic acid biosynthesis protein [Sandaracinus sp.]HJK91867.1 glycosyltransferase family protein [Polyangiaceae bacterium LLY-WYZ-15_(1-7)]MBJ70313.1 teichoic acid biosynthesis protein [Sandaracinus sp.]HJL04908.1 glycosyltransferase family protein [Polyangiaceae bacterium LLY-WYZ-15_(1-7)]
MRILYGVVGEGMGHAMRSRVVLEHLVAQGHEVEVMASGRAVDFLRTRGFEEVHAIHGLHIVYRDNTVRRNATFWSNVLEGAVALPKQIEAYFRLIEDFRPEAVISDFESWTYFYAKAHGLPVFSVDNMQIIQRCTHPDAILDGYRRDFRIAKALVKAKLPGCDHYLITTFFRPPIRKPKTSLHPPILRPEILAAEPSEGEHVLVYQTAQGSETLLEALRASGIECRIYGIRRDIDAEQVEGNLRFRPFAEQGFIDDLASARAVIANGGFTLMGECVYLHKPMLAVPLARMFEQIMNARYLDRLGYGRFLPDLDDPAAIHAFLGDVPRFREALADYAQDGNRDLLAAVDMHLDRAAAGLYG